MAAMLAQFSTLAWRARCTVLRCCFWKPHVFEVSEAKTRFLFSTFSVTMLTWGTKDKLLSSLTPRNVGVLLYFTSLPRNVILGTNLLTSWVLVEKKVTSHLSILSLSFLVLLHSSTALMASCRFSVATFFSLCEEERAASSANREGSVCSGTTEARSSMNRRNNSGDSTAP